MAIKTGWEKYDKNTDEILMPIGWCQPSWEYLKTALVTLWLSFQIEEEWEMFRTTNQKMFKHESVKQMLKRTFYQVNYVQ